MFIVCYDTLVQRITELFQEIEHGDIETNHQDPVPVAEE